MSAPVGAFLLLGCFLLHTVTLVNARGTLTIKLLSFENQHGRTYEGQCCDPSPRDGDTCHDKCDYVMRLIISGLGRANDHVFLFHRPLKYDSNNLHFQEHGSDLQLTVLFDTWPEEGHVKMNAFFYDYDDFDHTTALVDWFETELSGEGSVKKGQGTHQLLVSGNRQADKTRLQFEWSRQCEPGSVDAGEDGQDCKQQPDSSSSVPRLWPLQDDDDYNDDDDASTITRDPHHDQQQGRVSSKGSHPVYYQGGGGDSILKSPFKPFSTRRQGSTESSSSSSSVSSSRGSSQSWTPDPQHQLGKGGKSSSSKTPEEEASSGKRRFGDVNDNDVSRKRHWDDVFNDNGMSRERHLGDSEMSRKRLLEEHRKLVQEVSGKSSYEDYAGHQGITSAAAAERSRQIVVPQFKHSPFKPFPSNKDGLSMDSPIEEDSMTKDHGGFLDERKDSNMKSAHFGRRDFPEANRSPFYKLAGFRQLARGGNRSPVSDKEGMASLERYSNRYNDRASKRHKTMQPPGFNKKKPSPPGKKHSLKTKTPPTTTKLPPVTHDKPTPATKKLRATTKKPTPTTKKPAMKKHKPIPSTHLPSVTATTQQHTPQKKEPTDSRNTVQKQQRPVSPFKKPKTEQKNNPTNAEQTVDLQPKQKQHKQQPQTKTKPSRATVRPKVASIKTAAATKKADKQQKLPTKTQQRRNPFTPADKSHMSTSAPKSTKTTMVKKAGKQQKIPGKKQEKQSPFKPAPKSTQTTVTINKADKQNTLPGQKQKQERRLNPFKPADSKQMSTSAPKSTHTSMVKKADKQQNKHQTKTQQRQSPFKHAVKKQMSTRAPTSADTTMVKEADTQSKLRAKTRKGQSPFKPADNKQTPGSAPTSTETTAVKKTNRQQKTQQTLSPFKPADKQLTSTLAPKVVKQQEPSKKKEVNQNTNDWIMQAKDISTVPQKIKQPTKLASEHIEKQFKKRKTGQQGKEPSRSKSQNGRQIEKNRSKPHTERPDKDTKPKVSKPKSTQLKSRFNKNAKDTKTQHTDLQGYTSTSKPQSSVNKPKASKLTTSPSKTELPHIQDTTDRGVTYRHRVPISTTLTTPVNNKLTPEAATPSSDITSTASRTSQTSTITTTDSETTSRRNHVTKNSPITSRPTRTHTGTTPRQSPVTRTTDTTSRPSRVTKNTQTMTSGQHVVTHTTDAKTSASSISGTMTKRTTSRPQEPKTTTVRQGWGPRHENRFITWIPATPASNWVARPQVNKNTNNNNNRKPSQGVAGETKRRPNNVVVQPSPPRRKSQASAPAHSRGQQSSSGRGSKQQNPLNNLNRQSPFADKAHQVRRPHNSGNNVAALAPLSPKHAETKGKNFHRGSSQKAKTRGDSKAKRRNTGVSRKRQNPLLAAPVQPKRTAVNFNPNTARNKKPAASLKSKLVKTRTPLRAEAGMEDDNSNDTPRKTQKAPAYANPVIAHNAQKEWLKNQRVQRLNSELGIQQDASNAADGPSSPAHVKTDVAASKASANVHPKKTSNHLTTKSKSQSRKKTSLKPDARTQGSKGNKAKLSPSKANTGAPQRKAIRDFTLHASTAAASKEKKVVLAAGRKPKSKATDRSRVASPFKTDLATTTQSPSTKQTQPLGTPTDRSAKGKKKTEADSTPGASQHTKLSPFLPIERTEDANLLSVDSLQKSKAASGVKTTKKKSKANTRKTSQKDPAGVESLSPFHKKQKDSTKGRNSKLNHNNQRQTTHSVRSENQSKHTYKSPFASKGTSNDPIRSTMATQTDASKQANNKGNKHSSKKTGELPRISQTLRSPFSPKAKHEKGQPTSKYDNADHSTTSGPSSNFADTTGEHVVFPEKKNHPLELKPSVNVASLDSKHQLGNKNPGKTSDILLADKTVSSDEAKDKVISPLDSTEAAPRDVIKAKAHKPHAFGLKVNNSPFKPDPSGEQTTQPLKTTTSKRKYGSQVSGGVTTLPKDDDEADTANSVREESMKRVRTQTFRTPTAVMWYVTKHPAYALTNYPQRTNIDIKIPNDITIEGTIHVDTDSAVLNKGEKKYRLPELPGGGNTKPDTHKKIAVDDGVVVKQEKTEEKKKRKYRPGGLKSRLELIAHVTENREEHWQPDQARESTKNQTPTKPSPFTSVTRSDANSARNMNKKVDTLSIDLKLHPVSPAEAAKPSPKRKELDVNDKAKTLSNNVKLSPFSPKHKVALTAPAIETKTPQTTMTASSENKMRTSTSPEGHRRKAQDTTPSIPQRTRGSHRGKQRQASDSDKTTPAMHVKFEKLLAQLKESSGKLFKIKKPQSSTPVTFTDNILITDSSSKRSEQAISSKKTKAASNVKNTDASDMNNKDRSNLKTKVVSTEYDGQNKAHSSKGSFTEAAENNALDVLKRLEGAATTVAFQTNDLHQPLEKSDSLSPFRNTKGKKQSYVPNHTSGLSKTKRLNYLESLESPFKPKSGLTNDFGPKKKNANHENAKSTPEESLKSIPSYLETGLSKKPVQRTQLDSSLSDKTPRRIQPGKANHGVDSSARSTHLRRNPSNQKQFPGASSPTVPLSNEAKLLPSDLAKQQSLHGDQARSKLDQRFPQLSSHDANSDDIHSKSVVPKRDFQNDVHASSVLRQPSAGDVSIQSPSQNGDYQGDAQGAILLRQPGGRVSSLYTSDKKGKQIKPSLLSKNRLTAAPRQDVQDYSYFQKSRGSFKKSRKTADKRLKGLHQTQKPDHISPESSKNQQKRLHKKLNPNQKTPQPPTKTPKPSSKTVHSSKKIQNSYQKPLQTSGNQKNMSREETQNPPRRKSHVSDKNKQSEPDAKFSKKTKKVISELLSHKVVSITNGGHMTPTPVDVTPAIPSLERKIGKTVKTSKAADSKSVLVKSTSRTKQDKGRYELKNKMVSLTSMKLAVSPASSTMLMSTAQSSIAESLSSTLPTPKSTTRLVEAISISTPHTLKSSTEKESRKGKSFKKDTTTPRHNSSRHASHISTKPTTPPPTSKAPASKDVHTKRVSSGRKTTLTASFGSSTRSKVSSPPPSTASSIDDTESRTDKGGRNAKTKTRIASPSPRTVSRTGVKSTASSPQRVAQSGQGKSDSSTQKQGKQTSSYSPANTEATTRLTPTAQNRVRTDTVPTAGSSETSRVTPSRNRGVTTMAEPSTKLSMIKPSTPRREKESYNVESRAESQTTITTSKPKDSTSDRSTLLASDSSSTAAGVSRKTTLSPSKSTVVEVDTVLTSSVRPVDRAPASASDVPSLLQTLRSKIDDITTTIQTILTSTSSMDPSVSTQLIMTGGPPVGVRGTTGKTQAEDASLTARSGIVNANQSSTEPANVQPTGSVTPSGSTSATKGVSHAKEQTTTVGTSDSDVLLPAPKVKHNPLMALFSNLSSVISKSFGKKPATINPTAARYTPTLANSTVMQPDAALPASTSIIVTLKSVATKEARTNLSKILLSSGNDSPRQNSTSTVITNKDTSDVQNNSRVSTTIDNTAARDTNVSKTLINNVTNSTSIPSGSTATVSNATVSATSTQGSSNRTSVVYPSVNITSTAHPRTTTKPHKLLLTLPAWVTFPNKFKEMLGKVSRITTTATTTIPKENGTTTANNPSTSIVMSSPKSPTVTPKPTSETKQIKNKDKASKKKAAKSNNTTTKAADKTITPTAQTSEKQNNKPTQKPRKTKYQRIEEMLKAMAEEKKMKHDKDQKKKSSKDKKKTSSKDKKKTSSKHQKKTSAKDQKKGAGKDQKKTSPKDKTETSPKPSPPPAKKEEEKGKDKTEKKENPKSEDNSLILNLSHPTKKHTNTNHRVVSHVATAGRPGAGSPHTNKNASASGPQVRVPKKGLFVPRFVHYGNGSRGHGVGVKGSAEARHVSMRVQQLSVGTVFSRYWPAILGLTVGTVFLVVALLTSIACRQQRLFIQRRQGWQQDTPQHLTEPPDTSEYSSSASSLASDNTRSSIHFT